MQQGEGASAIPPHRWIKNTGRRTRAIVFIASHCHAHNDRTELVRRLMRALPPSLPVHSLGKCLHNHELPAKVLEQTAWETKGAAATASRTIFWSKVRVMAAALRI